MRRVRRRHSTILRAGALFGAAILICATASAMAEPPRFERDTPIIIAHVAPIVGRFAMHTEDDRRGVEMAVEDFNMNGGVLGREVIVVSRDPSMDPVRAAKVAEELITRSKVSFMVGALDSGVASAMSKVCQKYGVIFINTNSSAPSQAVEDAHRTKFVFDANAANYNRDLLHYALDDKPSKRVVLLVEDDVFGRSSADTARPYIAEAHGQIVGEISVPQAMPDPADVLGRVASLGADVVVAAITGDNQVKLMAQINPDVFNTQSWILGEADWEDLYPTPGIYRPLFGITWNWDFKTPGTAEFVERYRRLYGHTRMDYPGHVTHAAYLSTWALLTTIEQAGTTDNHAIIKRLEHFKFTAQERMQDDPAFMDPVSHHLQQSTYIATWKPNRDHPELSLKVLAHFTPEAARYERERTTQLESFEETPHYAP